MIITLAVAVAATATAAAPRSKDKTKQVQETQGQEFSTFFILYPLFNEGIKRGRILVQLALPQLSEFIKWPIKTRSRTEKKSTLVWNRFC